MSCLDRNYYTRTKSATSYLTLQTTAKLNTSACLHFFPFAGGAGAALAALVHPSLSIRDRETGLA